tara:strand:+ start:685 stop:1044 length:360 start_codon:yes stop_codon:yes gene_type:complete
MKEDAKSGSVYVRETTNELITDDVSQGKQQFQFMLETNPQIKDGLTWFESQIVPWDMASAGGVYSRENRLEHQDAWALQRDVNYLYSDRKRLMEIAHDTRYESAYQAQIKYLQAVKTKK